MRVIYKLSALSAEGFGGEDKYTQIVTIENEEELLRKKTEFALRYGVDLDMVKAQIWSR